MTKAVNELGLEWSPLRIHRAAGWMNVFSRGAIKAPRQCSFPFFPEVHTSSRYYDTPTTCLEESVAAHLCPPTAIGWKARASYRSKPCRATSALAGRAFSAAGRAASALHSMAVLQVFQSKMLANEEAGLDSASLRDLRSMTDLALRTTKTTAQAIWHLTSSLIMLERHLWLTMTEMKEADKVPFLHTPVSSGSLFGPAVEGFAERFTEAQKSSQCRHFLPKRTCSSSASSRPRPAPTQQTAKTIANLPGAPTSWGSAR